MSDPSPASGRVPEIAYRDEAPPDRASLLTNRLGPILAELERLRHDVRGQIRQRVMMFVPLGALGGSAFDYLRHINKPIDTGGVLFMAAAGAVIAYLWAVQPIARRYRNQYAQRVLPVLAADFGDFTYRAAQQPNFERLRREGLLPQYSSVDCDDEIVGRLRGHQVSIVEAVLSIRQNKRTREVFRGLITTVDLPRRVKGTIAILPDGGSIGNFASGILRRGSERIALEDPRFEAVYEVYGTDQIGARALLTPAFMERFLAIRDLPGFQRPLAFVEEDRMILVMPRPGTLFQPPSWRSPAQDGEVLVQLERGMASVLAMADAALDVDQSTRG